MAQYRVLVRVVIDGEVTVEADSPADAESEAENMSLSDIDTRVDDGHVEWCEVVKE